MDKRNLIVMVKCEIGKTYDVAATLADLPEGPTVYSTSGDYDLFTMFRLGTAALNNMTLSRSLTDLGVIYGMAREVNDVDLDKITFLKLPVYDLEGDYAGRVGVQTERASLLFEKLINDEFIDLLNANIIHKITYS